MAVASPVVSYRPPTQILAPAADGGSAGFEVGNGCNVCLRLSGSAAVLAGAETVTVYYYDADGNTRALVDAITGAAQMVAGDTTVTIAVQGRYLAEKSITAALTGVEIIENNAS